jgi:hypothetical protein
MYSSTCTPEWTLIDAELDVGMELDATARRLDLSYAQHETQATRGESNAWREARGAGGGTKHEAWVRHTRHEARGQASLSRPV